MRLVPAITMLMVGLSLAKCTTIELDSDKHECRIIVVMPPQNTDEKASDFVVSNSSPTRALQGYVLAKLPLASPFTRLEQTRVAVGVAAGTRWQVAARWLGRFEVATIQPISDGTLGDRYFTKEVDMNLMLTRDLGISLSLGTYPSTKWELMANCYI